jgi:hypothetical protein
MSNLYLLYDYDEHGPENLIATLDKNSVIDLIKSTPYPESGWLKMDRAEKAMAEDEPGRVALTDGWGGLVLHIVKLTNV